jgi:hypothetical protein
VTGVDCACANLIMAKNAKTVLTTNKIRANILVARFFSIGRATHLSLVFMLMLPDEVDLLQ